MRFDDYTLDRLKKMLIWWESSAQQNLVTPALYREGPMTKFAQTTSSITAASGSTLGTGTANLVSVKGGTVDASTTTGVTVYSDASTAIASGKSIVVVYIDGIWFVVYAAC